jgi:type IV secretion system protein VirB5
MNRMHKVLVSGVACALTVGVVPTQAMIPVIDITAIVRLVQQINVMTSQLTTLQAHLAKAQQAYDAITGGRGMDLLLSGTVRNYLPADWAALQAAVEQTGNAYSALSARIQTALRANQVLSDAQLGQLSPAVRDQVLAARKTAATLQAVSQEALTSTSQRFASLQTLIDAIGRAGDSKAVMDLQARIQAEQGMLANEQTKLQVLYQANQAEQQAWQQKTREQVMADVGSLRSLRPMGL